MSEVTYEKMKAALDSYCETALAIPGVHGISIGLKRINGELTGTLAICIHLDKKKPVDEIPEDERVPDEIDGIPTDVLEHPRPRQLADPGKYRPVQGGIQIQNWAHTGTLGCMVRDRTDGEICALSNDHVFYSEETGQFQPATFPPCDKIGSTKRLVYSQVVDGGIATVKDYDAQYVAKIVGIGDVMGTYDVTMRDLPYPVRKRGRTTELTTGSVTNIQLVTTPEGHRFYGQLFIVSDKGMFCDNGDSGSVIVDSKNNIVGLLWGGGDVDGVASPIEAVLRELEIDVVTASMAEELISQASHTDTISGKLERLLCQSDRGRGYWQAFRDNEDHLRHLFHETPRLFATWQKLPREELATVLLEAISNPESTVPSTIGAMDTMELISTLRDAVLRYSDDASIRALVESLHDDLKNHIGKCWSSVFSEG